jgi:hypothetical protein
VQSTQLQDEGRSRVIVLDDKSVERGDQLNTTEINELAKKELLEHPEVLEVVEGRKMRKFTWSGIYVIALGLLLVGFGLLLNIGVSSVKSLVVGIGVIVVIIGILRFLIGLIKPIVPHQL